MKNNYKGITLVALVITIIVLLILAGVTISLTLGDNGIFKTAEQSATEHKKAEVKEKIIMMLADYATKRHTEEKKLIDYLNEQKDKGELSEVIDNEDATYTVEKDGYEIIIKDSDLTIISIEKARVKPQISNIQVTTDGTTIAGEQSVIIGKPVYINFTHMIEGGTTTVDKQLPYKTNGNELEVTFTITGIVDGESYTKDITISLANIYREAFIGEVVKVGDFVNYSLGNWTQSDIAKLGSLYSGAAADYKFSGFGTSTSKDNSINIQADYNNTYSGGWRVLSKNSDGSINIIHAGTPEGFKNPYRGAATSSSILLTTRNWSMYEDVSTDSVDTNFAIAGSAHCISYNEAYNITGSAGNTTNNLRNINVSYWVPKPGESGESMSCIMWGPYGSIKAYNNYYGVRVILKLKSSVKAKAKTGQTTHITRETAWQLSE